MKLQTKLVMVSGFLLFAQPGHLLADQSTGKERSAALEDITVTANKVEENVQNVPQSVSVFDERGIEDVADIVQEVPNLSINPIHGNALNFRGLNISVFTVANPVVLYVDGVAMVDAFGYDTSLVDVERVEVLRGPQGTLYGKDAIGGVINIVSKDPENEWHGKIGAEYGSYNHMRGFFGTNGALIADTLYAGISGQYIGSDGWIENIHNGINDDKAAAEASRRFNGFLFYKPTDKFGVRFTLAHDYASKDFMDGYGFSEYNGDIDFFSRDDAKKVDFDTPTEEEVKSFSQNLNMQYDFGAVTLTSVTSHRKMNFDGDYDVDRSSSPMYAGLVMFDHSERESLSEELRLASNNAKALRWLVGIYVDDDTRNQGPYGMQFPNFDRATSAFLGNFEIDAVSAQTSNTYAAFGQVTIPFWQRVELTLGGRYQHIDKDINLDMYYLPMGVKGPAMFTLAGDKSWDTFLPKAALSYTINKAWTSYLSFSQGYMSGGFNGYATFGGVKENSFEPQRSTNYEIGVKGKYDRLRLAASLFYMDIEDIHVYKTEYMGKSVMQVVDNADSAHSYGAEADLSYWLTDSLEISGTAGIIEAKYDDYDAGGGVHYDGEQIENTPEYSFNLGLAYFHPAGIYSRLDVRNQGSVNFFDSTGQQLVERGGYTTVDARIGYQFDDWDLYVYGKNITDEEYVTAWQPSVTTFAYFNEPLTIGIGAIYRF